MPETLWRTFFATPFEEGKLYRPIASLSLALNWYIGQNNPIGYHIVNIFIHYFNTLLLYFIILELFSTPALKNKYNDESRYFFALLASIFWAIHPIQTQSVTYIVQRMASLGTLFFLIAIYFYLKGRFSQKSSYIPFIACTISFLLALGSKENTVILPITLLLIEYTFYYKENEYKSRTFLNFFLCITLIIIVVGTYYLFKTGVIPNFFQLAGSRPFSYYERLLTESRIIFFYLSLLLYPIPSRLSIDHDIVISTSPFAPITTFLSILGILLLIILAFQQIRKRPLVSFAILFFFINHLVESTVVPLELVFEHRNYLPSLFLFLPLAVGLYSLLSHYSTVNRFVYFSTIGFIIFLIGLIGIGTYIRNMAYSSSEGLWKDTISKAPLSARALSNLGIIEGWGKEKSERSLTKALSYHMTALNSTQYRSTFKPAILGNIGGIFYNYGLMDKALEYFKKSIDLNHTYINGHYNLARTYLRIGEYQLALNETSLILENAQPETRFYNLHGLILLWMEKPTEALQAFRAAMKMSKDKKRDYYDVGSALSLSGSFKTARWFLEQAKQEERTNLRIALSLLENSIRAHNQSLIQKDSRYVVENFDMASLSEALKVLPTDRRSVPVDTELIRPVIEVTAKELSGLLFRK
jgi:protein O-mannosyl-transferase